MQQFARACSALILFLFLPPPLLQHIRKTCSHSRKFCEYMIVVKCEEYSLSNIVDHVIQIMFFYGLPHWYVILNNYYVLWISSFWADLLYREPAYRKCKHVLIFLKVCCQLFWLLTSQLLCSWISTLGQSASSYVICG